MREEKYYLTKEGLKKTKAEYAKLLKLRKLKSKSGAPSVLHSEELDAEFIAFREDLDFLESKIEELDHVLKNFSLIKLPSKKQKDMVQLGAKLRVELDDDIDEFMLVGTLEANPSQKKISNESPIGRALINHKVGDEVVIKTESVNHKCKILAIRYDKK